MPEVLDQPNQVDYLTDEESDDGQAFELKVPQLKDLLDEFETGDDVLMQAETDLKQRATDLKSRGVKPDLREDIILEKQNR